MLKVWSQKSHLLHSSDEQLTYIECALVCFVKYAKDEVRKGMKWLAEEWLLNGTQYHLKSSDTRRKIRGLFITEKLTEWLSFGHDLKFDITPEMGQELVDLRAIVDEDQLEVLSKSAEANNEAMKNNNLNNEKNENSLEKLSRNLEKLSTKGAPPSQLDSDDDDDFPSYQIPEQELNLSEKKPSGDEDDETFEKPEPAPYYIRDCMDALGANENCAKFEAAFGVLNQFIRKRALGYDDIAEELVTKMVFLEDRFSTVKFEERKFEIIVSCLVMSPHLAPMLIDLMYSRRSPMCYRYLILNCLAESATQLSTLDTASAKIQYLEGLLKENQSICTTKQKFPAAPSSDWRGVIEERLEKKTRRFTSQKASSSTSTPQKNRFGEHAVGFLRPLLAINQYREHLDLRKEDSSLLAKILTTAAHLMQCARNCLNAPRLAMWLEVCVRELISHEDASVRLAVLLCYDAICRALPDDVFFTLFTGSVNEWLAYTVYVIENDPSGMCREMAVTLQYTICSKAPQNSI
ncbi:unnamed protein product [Anisakis simplex]|uniref:Telomere length regulation protein conserved domain-containing protein n=1 Tax=Anisakis simplex TaxID=6269 RepID=A0A3P6PE21_ANISI|nr:unnamed protein product [Anisakis simplex]